MDITLPLGNNTLRNLPAGKVKAKARKRDRWRKKFYKNAAPYVPNRVVDHLTRIECFELVLDLCRGTYDPKCKWFYYSILSKQDFLFPFRMTIDECVYYLQKAWEFGLLEEDDVIQQLYYEYYKYVFAVDKGKMVLYLARRIVIWLAHSRLFLKVHLELRAQEEDLPDPEDFVPVSEPEDILLPGVFYTDALDGYTLYEKYLLYRSLEEHHNQDIIALDLQTYDRKIRRQLVKLQQKLGIHLFPNYFNEFPEDPADLTDSLPGLEDVH